ncbi:MAG: aldo/keto reductase [Peptococcaceae bacterium]|nr:aldo/keto reductase [Peptococcaceae bacterium]
MDTRSYKGTSDHVSLLGFGCMRLPTIDDNPKFIDMDKALEMVDYALEQGVNYFDTAYPYHMGASESFVGEALSRYPRESYHLATKMPIFALRHQEEVERIFLKQLENCRTDYFDFYMLHSVNEEMFEVAEKYAVYEFLKQKQEEGVIRRLGFSYHGGTELLGRLVERYPFDFAQLQINYVDWDLQNAGHHYEIVTAKGIPVIVMEPVRGGALATLTESAREIFRAADAGASPASWALRYCASLPNVFCILSGMTTLEQLKDNVATLSGFKPLSEAEYDVINRALVAYRSAGVVPCTACGYCMDCPSGVDIPRVFGLFNEWRATGNNTEYSIGVEQLGEEKNAGRCTACGVCVDLCPQGINIPEWMQEIEYSITDHLIKNVLLKK